MGIDKALSIPGYMKKQELEWLAFTASLSKLIVEFGCFKGRSTRALADNTSGIIHAVDPWDGVYYDNNNGLMTDINTDCRKDFEANLQDHIENKRVFMHQMFADDFSLLDEKADFVFIDGDHRYEQVKKDIKLALAISKSGAIISGHDYTYEYMWPGVKKAVDESFKKVALCRSIWYTIKP